MFSVAITKRQTKRGYRFEAEFTYEDKYGNRKRCSKKGFRSANEAKNSIERQKVSLASGKDILRDPTLFEVFNEYMEISQIQYNTKYNTRKYINVWNGKHAIMDLGSMQINKIDYKTLLRFCDLRKNCSYESNKDINNALKRIFRYAYKQKYIESNPMEYISTNGKRSIPNKDFEKKVVSIPDLNTVIDALEAMDTSRSRAAAMVCRIAVMTGMRLSEIMALEKKDIHWGDDAYIDVRRKLLYKGLKKEKRKASNNLKSRASYGHVVIIDELKRPLKIWCENISGERLFADKNGYYMSPDSIGNLVHRVGKEHGIDIHVHMLRHTFASLLLQDHPDNMHTIDQIKIAQEMLRHASFNTTLTIYTHVNQEDIRNYANKSLDGILKNLR